MASFKRGNGDGITDEQIEIYRWILAILEEGSDRPGRRMAVGSENTTT